MKCNKTLRDIELSDLKGRNAMIRIKLCCTFTRRLCLYFPRSALLDLKDLKDLKELNSGSLGR